MEQRWENIEEDDEVVAFEIEVASGQPTDNEDINLVHLRVPEKQRNAAEETLRRARERHQLMRQITALRKQAQCQYEAQDFANALHSYKQALGLAPDHPGIIEGMSSCQTMLTKRQAADQILQKADSALREGDTAAALDGAQEVLAIFPRDTKALALVNRCPVDHDVSTAVDVTESGAVKHAAERMAENILSDLDLSANATLNFQMFSHWWQNALSHGGSHPRISDEELQRTVVIWHESCDTAEQGEGAVDAAGLAVVIAKMLQQNIIRATVDGHVYGQ